jgi:hypothetical protein
MTYRTTYQAWYRTTYQAWPAFTVTGITRIVASGGEVYNAVRRDGRWEALRRLGGEDATLYGVASFDKACSQGTYRYTLGVKGALAAAGDLLAGETLFSLPIRQAGWLVFELDDFEAQYGGFWRDATIPTGWSRSSDGPLTTGWVCTSTSFHPPTSRITIRCHS